MSQRKPDGQRPNGQCFCRCGRAASPGRYFAPGHDTRVKTILDAIDNQRPVIDRMIAEGFHFGPGGRSLREAALASSAGYYGCAVDKCKIYGRGPGMARHVAEHEAGDID